MGGLRIFERGRARRRHLCNDSHGVCHGAYHCGILVEKSLLHCV